MSSAWPDDDLILYDGVCIFCSRWIRFVAIRDVNHRFRFTAIQSPYGTQLAQAFGYDVVGVDVGDDRVEFIRSLGARIAVDAGEALEVVQRELGGVDAALVFSPRMAGFDLGFKLLRRGGLFVAVGLPATSEGNFSINPFEFFFKDATLIYSAVGTVQDMRELVALAAAGRVKSHVSRRGKLSDLPSIFDDLEAGRYVGRAVLTDLAH